MLTTKQWLKSTRRLSTLDASGAVKTAKPPAVMPQIRETALTGALPGMPERILAQARGRHPEAVFADIGTYLDARDLRRAVEHWRQQIDHAAAVEDTMKRHERRHLSVDRTHDDM